MSKYNSHWTITSVLEEAKAGDPRAQFVAAEYLWEGRHTVQDLPLAVFWYEKAARAGHPEAQCNLAYAYATGRGVETCPEKAFYWYDAAAQTNNIRALRSLAACYAQGFGVQKCVDKAYGLLVRAMNLQLGVAMNGCGFDRC